jgi:hypothetical protein
MGLRVFQVLPGGVRDDGGQHVGALAAQGER